MNNPPFGPDPDATQPMPAAQFPPPIPPPPRGAGRPPRDPASAVSSGVPRFGNVPLYLLARLLAFGIDVLALGIAIAAFGFHAFERGFLTLAGRTEGGFAALAGASFALALLFAFLCEALFGATLGKAIFGLRVRRSNGGHAGVARIFVRYLLRPIDLLLVGPILALVTPRHQRIGDFAGGTVVSRYRFGPLASVVGIVLLVAIAYAQGVFGGGFTTLLELGAEAANYGPDLVAKTAALAGVTVLHSPVLGPDAIASPSPVASEAPTPAAPDAPSAAPVEAPTSAPAEAATDAATAGPATVTTDAPEETPDPTEAPAVQHA